MVLDVERIRLNFGHALRVLFFCQVPSLYSEVRRVQRQHRTVLCLLYLGVDIFLPEVRPFFSLLFYQALFSRFEAFLGRAVTPF